VVVMVAVEVSLTHPNCGASKADQPHFGIGGSSGSSGSNDSQIFDPARDKFMRR
jgi:hypothetical protein